MKILILGGTAFLGPQLVEAAQDAGDEVTLFNRGKTNPGLFPDVEKLHGDRDPQKGEGLKALADAVKAGRRWDAVIDTSGYVPRVVRASAELLKDAARQYVFISTVSVYPNFTAGMDETAPVGTLQDPAEEKVSGLTYGPLKVLCEAAATAVFGDRATNIRPGLIVGPGDPTDRFTYWPVRVARGGRVLIPAAPQPRKAFVSFIDVRDLASWSVRCARDGHGGVYNASGPKGTLTFDEMVDGCKAVVSDPVDFIPVEEAWLLKQGVGPWMQLPLWIPAEPGETAGGMGLISRTKAVEHGLTFRPLADTARDTLAWFNAERPADYDFGTKPGAAGLTKAREAELLAAWAARPGG